METTADEKHLLSFIKQIAMEQNFTNFEVQVTPVSSGGANFSSKLYRVKISGKGRDDLDLFAKAAILSEKTRSQILLDHYETERFVYTNLFQSYRRLEEKHGVPEENRLSFPKHYGTDMTHMQEIVVFEDLTNRGFSSVNRLESLSIAYQHENPSDFDKIISKFPTGMFPESEDTNFLFNQCISSALAAVREENKKRLNIFLKRLNSGKSYNDMFEALKRKVLTHGDFRTSNMLHRVKNDNTTEVIPVDYQTVQVGSPVIDLLYFIFTATDGLFRAKYYQKLVSHYYSELGAALARLGLDVEEKYSKEDFEFEMKQKLSFGLVIVVLILPMITVAEDQAPSLDASLDLTSFAVKVANDLYSQRLNEVVDEYVEWGVL